MTPIIDDKEVEQVHTMEDIIAVVEQSSLQRDPARNCQWGTMVEKKPSRRPP